MPKPKTYPIVFDDLLQLNITTLNKWKLLDKRKIQRAVLTISKGRNLKKKVLLYINMIAENPFIILTYYDSKKIRTQKVNLNIKSSNLNKGVIYYFYCPKKNRYCRKLYYYRNSFCQRQEISNAVYQSQIESKKSREYNKMYDSYFIPDEIIKEYNKPHLKKTYKGKLTKKFKKLNQIIERSENFTDEEVYFLFYD